MADWGAALTAQLLAAPALSALVGEDVDWGNWAEAGGERQVTLAVISDGGRDHFSGRIAHRQSRVQADCWSTVSAGDAAEIAEALIAAVRLDPGAPDPLEGEANPLGSWVRDGVRFDRPQIEGPVDSVERTDTVMLYRARVDLLLWHCEIEGA